MTRAVCSSLPTRVSVPRGREVHMSDRIRLVEDVDGPPSASVNSLVHEEGPALVAPSLRGLDHEHTDHLGCACGRFSLFKLALERGISKWNILAYFWAITITISAYVFINACQGYVLANFLGIDKDEQGSYQLRKVIRFTNISHECSSRDNTSSVTSLRNIYGRSRLLQRVSHHPDHRIVGNALG